MGNHVVTQQYTVSVSNTFDAVSHEDAIIQMVGWLLDNAHAAGYRSTLDAALGHPDGSVFIDAERIY